MLYGYNHIVVLLNCDNMKSNITLTTVDWSSDYQRAPMRQTLPSGKYLSEVNFDLREGSSLSLKSIDWSELNNFNYLYGTIEGQSHVYCYFITNVVRQSDSVTRIDVERDWWNEFINNAEIQPSMIARKPASNTYYPAAESEAKEYPFETLQTEPVFNGLEPRGNIAFIAIAKRKPKFSSPGVPDGNTVNMCTLFGLMTPDLQNTEYSSPFQPEFNEWLSYFKMIPEDIIAVYAIPWVGLPDGESAADLKGHQLIVINNDYDFSNTFTISPGTGPDKCMPQEGYAICDGFMNVLGTIPQAAYTTGSCQVRVKVLIGAERPSIVIQWGTDLTNQPFQMVSCQPIQLPYYDDALADFEGRYKDYQQMLISINTMKNVVEGAANGFVIGSLGKNGLAGGAIGALTNVGSAALSGAIESFTMPIIGAAQANLKGGTIHDGNSYQLFQLGFGAPSILKVTCDTESSNRINSFRERYGIKCNQVEQLSLSTGYWQTKELLLNGNMPDIARRTITGILNGGVYIV